MILYKSVIIVSINRSLLGGQLMVITGNGFGSSSDGMEITINAVPCSIKAITDTTISCMTGSTAYTHKITNNAYVVMIIL